MTLKGHALWPTATRLFFEENTGTIRSPRTRRNWGHDLKQLQDMHPAKRVSEFTEDDLLGFVNRQVQGRAAAPNTVLTRRAVLQSFFSWALWRGLISSDPSAGLRRAVRVRSQNTRSHHWLTEAQVGQLVESCRGEDVSAHRDLLIVMLGVFTGLRRQEMADLTWLQVNVPARTINLVGKGEKPAMIGIPRQLVEAFDLWKSVYTAGLGRMPTTEPLLVRTRALWGEGFGSYRTTVALWGRPVGANGILNAVQARGKSIGIPDLAPHDLRRTFAGLLEAKGKRIEEISKALRHSNVGTTQRYLEQNPAKALKVVADFEIDL